MGFANHVANGLISTAISIAVVYALGDDDSQPWELDEMTLSVALSSFFSGFFTSYFAKP
jgi:hypothetical protein